jgi:hypothetical protein
MRGLIYQAVVTIGVLVMLWGIAIPWVISNQMLPLWLDAIIFIFCMIGWVELARPTFKKLYQTFKKMNNEEK